MIAEAKVAQRGAELVVTGDDGKVRRVPLRTILARLPPPPGAPAPPPEVRIASAAVAAGWRGVEVALTDGTLRSLSEDAPPLGKPAPGRPCELVVIGIGQLLTMEPDAPGATGPLGALLPKANSGGLAIAVSGGRIAWIGPADEVTSAVTLAPDASLLDAGGALVTPGLIEPHAHPIFAGSRAPEFAALAAGASYLEIAAAGGGIASTVRLTRLATDDALVAGARARLQRLAGWGVTTAEAKTGYALTEDGELRLLSLLAEASALGPVELAPTLLAAHVVPPEARGDAARRAEWVRVCAEVLPGRARGLAESVDVFCDEGAYTVDEARAICEGARRAGLPVRLHADQLAAIGASALAAELGALSVDHLEHLPDAVIPALLRAGSVAVLLPGATLNLKQPLPPARKLLDAGVPVAIGTDLNPGSSMTEALPLQMWLAITTLGMSVAEAWLAVTVNAARAVQRPEAGRLCVGGPADLVVWSVPSPEAVPYHYGENHARIVIKDGVPVAAR